MLISISLVQFSHTVANTFLLGVFFIKYGKGGKTETIYRKMYDKAINGIIDNLVCKRNQLTYVAGEKQYVNILLKPS